MMKLQIHGAVSLGAVFLLCRAGAAHTQTDYYNTDEGRPIRIEDAFPVERHGFELQLAPLRLERESGGVYHWEVEPELAWGILPRTQVEVGFPVRFRDASGGTVGLAGISLSALHNLNTETRIPALAVAAGVTLPVGSLAPDRTYGSVKGIATRTFGFARFHANGQLTLGPDAEAGDDVGEASRWMAGLAVDRTLPLRSLLLTADVFAEQPLLEDAELGWTAEAGIRYQTSPQFNLDLGLGRGFSGQDQGWFVTLGFAQSFALRSLMGGSR
jgi:hypothetical protein